ncbi:hypothetical protein HZ326_11942 [Fusarium oxysporum f. sp. albedinis]|nr:hypothetical protein HZ326_11942 [Fusarium oxysporum f. sp. albedinis]
MSPRHRKLPHTPWFMSPSGARFGLKLVRSLTRWLEVEDWSHVTTRAQTSNCLCFGTPVSKLKYHYANAGHPDADSSPRVTIITDNLNYLRTRAEHRITRWTVARPPVVYSQSKALRYLSSQDWMLFIQGEVIYYLGHCFPASSQTKAVPASPISRTDQTYDVSFCQREHQKPLSRAQVPSQAKSGVDPRSWNQHVENVTNNLLCATFKKYHSRCLLSLQKIQSCNCPTVSFFSHEIRTRRGLLVYFTSGFLHGLRRRPSDHHCLHSFTSAHPFHSIQIQRLHPGRGPWLADLYLTHNVLLIRD